MTTALKRLVLPLLVMMVTLFTLVSPAYASPSLARRPANLTIEPLKPILTGDHPTITVHLTTETGKPIPNQPIFITVDGARKGQGRTDSRGIASITLKYKFSAKTYDVQAVYPGIISIGLNSATAEAALVVNPARLAIYTVPPTPGVVFKLNGQTFTSDKDGMANLAVNDSGAYSLEVLPIDSKNLPSNVRMEFAQWNDNIFTAKRQLYLPRTRRLEVGFTVNYQVKQVFYDSEGALVDPARIASMTIRGEGSTFKFDKAGPIWLPANRLVRRSGERLQSQQIRYYFRDVTIDGANAINKSEQRFEIHPDDVWPIQVLLYSIHFSARDAMFRFPIGKGIELTYPDGHAEQFLFDSHEKEMVISSLARGSYSARIVGAGGSVPLTPVHLSRDQSAELLIFSYLDMAALLLLGLVISLGLLFLGRPSIAGRVGAVISRTIPRRKGIQPATR